MPGRDAYLDGLLAEVAGTVQSATDFAKRYVVGFLGLGS